MKRVVCSVSMVLMFVAAVSGPAMAQTTFKIMAEALPPFNFDQNGVVRGISADALVEIMKMAGMPLAPSAITIVPWARGYNAAQEDPGAMLFSVARTEQREPLFAWVGPIMDLTLGLIAAKEKHIVLKTLKEAEKYKIGSVRDGAPEQLVLSGGVPESSLDRISDPTLNIKKLQAGRIELFAFNVPTTSYLMKQMGLNLDDYEVVYPLKQTGLYFAFHKGTDEAVIAKLNAALQQLKTPDASGKSAFDQIVETYLGAAQK